MLSWRSSSGRTFSTALPLHLQLFIQDIGGQASVLLKIPQHHGDSLAAGAVKSRQRVPAKGIAGLHLAAGGNGGNSLVGHGIEEPAVPGAQGNHQFPSEGDLRHRLLGIELEQPHCGGDLPVHSGDAGHSHSVALVGEGYIQHGVRGQPSEDLFKPLVVDNDLALVLAGAHCHRQVPPEERSALVMGLS